MATDDNKIVTIKNTEAALDNFEEAILLFFERRKSIPICTLAHAAHEILSKTTKDSIIRDKSLLNQEGKKLVWEKFSEAKNFAKHPSENDLTFNTGQNEIILLDCAYMIKNHITMQHLEANAFICWMYAENPELFTLDGIDEIKAVTQQIDVTNFEEIAAILKTHRLLK